MARKKRMESIGYYHIVNRGVERRRIFMDDEDHLRFLAILDESAQVYGFTIHAYALMGNHYHLLLQTTALNLSLLMRQINGRYSVYFNNKYRRVGPLWQGRFKSWYVYDADYLKTLVRYIESNPVKAGLAQEVGQYRWTMSAHIDKRICLDYSLIDAVDLTRPVNENEMKQIEQLHNAPLEKLNDTIAPKTRKELAEHFAATSRESGIASAIGDGYKQREIAKYLRLSPAAVSKIYKTYRRKVALFDKLRDKGIFWSYSKTITFADAGENLLIEYLYKYGDFDDIKEAFGLFGTRVMRRVWEERLASDRRFKKLNFMIARVFLGMKIEADYFEEVKNGRLEKLRMLAS